MMQNKLNFYIKVSFLLHFVVLVIWFVVYQVQWVMNSKPIMQAGQPKPTPVIQAVVIDERQIKEHFQKIEQEKQRKIAEQKARALAKKRKEQRLAKERQRRELERQRREKKLQEIARQKKEAARKAKEKRLVEQRLKQEQKRRQQEAQRLAKQQELRQRELKAERLKIEQEIQEQLALEQQEFQKVRQQQMMDEISRYRSLIQATIQRHLIVQEGMRGKSCVVNIRLAEDGFVTQVQRISGDPVVCRQTETAIYKSKRLPISEDPSVYDQMKNINIIVKPEFN